MLTQWGLIGSRFRLARVARVFRRVDATVGCFLLNTLSPRLVSSSFQTSTSTSISSTPFNHILLLQTRVALPVPHILHRSDDMFVYKRGKSTPPSCLTSQDFSLTLISDGRKERVQFDKITARVSRLCYGLDPEHVDSAAITMKVISGVYQGVTTIQLDDLVSTQSEENM